MADKKELYEILCEGINSKMDLVLEGYSDMGRRFEEARIERQETKADLKEAKECLTGKMQETRN